MPTPMHWIKLHIEILSDPKMGRLSDRLWRRSVEMFMLAGKFDAGGYLPPIEDMAWELRTSTEELTQELEALAAVNIVELRDGEWYVTHFAERQDKDSNAVRQKRYRERKQKGDYYSNDSVTERNAESNAGSNDSVTEHNTEKRREEKTLAPDGAESEPPAPPSNGNGRTADDIKAGVMAAIQSYGARQEAGAADLSWCPEYLEPLAREFVASTGIQPIKSERDYWIKSLGQYYEAGVKPQDIKKAVRKMRTDGLTIKSPGSVFGNARDEANKRVNPDDEKFTEEWG